MGDLIPDLLCLIWLAGFPIIIGLAIIIPIQLIVWLVKAINRPKPPESKPTTRDDVYDRMEEE